MNSSVRIAGFSLAIGLVLISVFVWIVANHEEAEQGRLVTNIGEIQRIDEILSSSALLATATGDPAYETRYLTHVGMLDQLLGETMEHFSNDQARAMLERTEAANHILVSIEKKALADTAGKPNPAAYASLRTPEYLANKRIYRDGSIKAFLEMQKVSKQTIERVHFVLMGLALALVVMTAILSRLMWKSQIDMSFREQQAAQVEMMRAMIRTFMDVQNNLLNNMVYFRTKAAHNLPFDDDEIDLIDGEIDSAKQKLADIADSEIPEVRDLGGLYVLSAADRTTGKSRSGQGDLPKVA